MDVEIVHGVGEYSHTIKNSNDRVAYVISQGNDITEAIEACKNALDKIKIEVEE